MRWYECAGVALAVLTTAPVWGQDTTRADEIERARTQKEQELSPPKDPGLERAIDGIQEIWRIAC
jgi:hypothetical protein